MKTQNLLLKLLGILFLLFSFPAFSQTNQDVLTNETVTTLFKKGLGSSIIINKIKSSKTAFDVSTEALIKLKEEGLPDDIVSEMIESASKNKTEVVNLNDPLTRHNPGIYFFNPNDADKALVRIDPTVVSAGKSGGFGQALANSYSYGLANIKTTSVISGPNAHKQLSGNSITFYFYIQAENSNMGRSGASNWWFTTASSPNEFALVKLDQKKDSRQFDTGKSNAYGSSVGIDEKKKIQFNYSEVAEGIFKITITGDLKPGEYCFIYTGATPSMYSNDKVFDFGIY